MNKQISVLAVLVLNCVVANPSIGIETKNSVFLPQKTRTISQAQMKVAQGIGTGTRVIRLRLSDSGLSVASFIFWGPAGLIQKRSTDWVRLEITGNQVRVIHTTRTTNWFTQFSKWWDHPIRKIAFKPDSCTVDNVQKTSEPNPNQTTTTNPDCVVISENGVIELKDIAVLTQGEFKIEYLESGEWKYVTFRVPEKSINNNE